MDNTSGENGFKPDKNHGEPLKKAVIDKDNRSSKQGVSVSHEEGEITLEMWEGRDQQLFKTCVKYNVEFSWPLEDETPEETKLRREELQRKCKAARQRQKRNEMSPELRDTLRARQAERMRLKRSQMSPEERRLLRAQQAERMRRRRQSLSPLELETVRARRAAIVRETRRRRRLEKLQAEGTINIKDTIQTAVAARCSLNDLNILHQTRILNGTGDLQVINVTMPDSICSHCGKQVIQQSHNKTVVKPNNSVNGTVRIFNFGLAPNDVAKSFHEFCTTYGSLSEALLDLLERERLLVKKYRFIPDTASQSILAMATSDDYPDVLQTTIETLKKFTKNSKYISVANAIEELLFSPSVSLGDSKIGADTATDISDEHGTKASACGTNTSICGTKTATRGMKTSTRGTKTSTSDTKQNEGTNATATITSNATVAILGKDYSHTIKLES